MGFNVIKKIISLLILLLLFTSPFIYSPKEKISYEIPRVRFFCWLVELTMLIIVSFILFLILFKFQQIDFEIIFLNLLRSTDSFLLINLIIFIFIVIISSFLGVNFYKSFFGNYYRGDGIFTLFHLVIFSLVIFLFFNDDWKELIPIGISISTVLLSLFILYSGIRLHFFNDQAILNWQKAIVGPFGQPNFLAGYLAVATPFSFYFFSFKKNIWKIFSLFLISLQFLAILSTFSWGGILTFFIGIYVWLMLMISKRWKRIIVSLLFIILIIGFFILYFLKEKRSDFVFEGRRRIFYKVFFGALKKPFFGLGWSNVDYAFESFDWPIKIEKDIYVDKAHSHLLEIFTTTGLVGLVFYILFLINVFKKILKKIKKEKNKRIFWQIILVVFLVFIFHSQTNVISIAEEILFWLVVGLTIKN